MLGRELNFLKPSGIQKFVKAINSCERLYIFITIIMKIVVSMNLPDKV